MSTEYDACVERDNRSIERLYVEQVLNLNPSLDRRDRVLREKIIIALRTNGFKVRATAMLFLSA